MDPIVEHLKPLDGGRILDVATGHCDFLKLMIDSFGSYSQAVGIDFDRRISEATEQNPESPFELKVMDAEQIDYEDGYFDTVAIRNSLHHLTNPQKVLAEMKRVLKPGGLWIIGEVFQAPETERTNSQRHLHHFWGEVDREFDIPHYPTFTREETLALLTEAGIDTGNSFDYLAAVSDEDRRKGLDFMLEHTERQIARLVDEADRPDLVTHGKELVRRFRTESWINESVVYILARR